MGYRGRAAVDPHVLVAEVIGTQRVSSHVVRATLGGEGLERFTAAGFDQWFRLFLPREGQGMLKLPTATSGWWYAQYLATPRSRRPWVRNYTVRAARADVRELDVDFVVHSDEHGHSGPAVQWVLGAQPGDRVGLLDQGVGYNPRHDHEWTLLVADETGLPAVAGVCASLPGDARGLAIVEVPAADDTQDFRVPAGVDLRWVVRSGPHAVPGEAALGVVRGADLPPGAVYAFAVGESALATGVRRHLVADRGVPKTHVDFVGYWRLGRAAG